MTTQQHEQSPGSVELALAKSTLSVDRATAWLREIADAYGWHLIAGRKTSAKHVYELHGYATLIRVKLMIGCDPEYSADVFSLGGWVYARVDRPSTFQNAEQWIWKLTQEARQAVGFNPIKKCHRRSCKADATRVQ